MTPSTVRIPGATFPARPPNSTPTACGGQSWTKPENRPILLHLLLRLAAYELRLDVIGKPRAVSRPNPRWVCGFSASCRNPSLS